jgi:hypothetical protein
VLEPDLVESRGTAKLALAFNPAIAILFRLMQLRGLGAQLRALDGRLRSETPPEAAEDSYRLETP